MLQFLPVSPESLKLALHGDAALVQGGKFVPQLVEAEQALGCLVVISVPHPFQLCKFVNPGLGFLLRVPTSIRPLQFDHPVKVTGELFGLASR